MINHEVSPRPAHAGPVTVTLRLSDSAAQPVTGAHIKIEGDMTHAGMAPVFGDAKEVEPGRYQSPLVFQMAGDWVVLLHITLPDGKKLEQQFNVPGVQSN
jgi:YtkA-like